MAEIFFSTACSSYEFLGPVLAEMTGWGIRHIELSGNLKFEPDLEKKVVYWKSTQGIEFSMHHYFPPPEQEFVLNLASGDPWTKRQTFGLIRKAFALMKEADIPLFGIHGGHNVDMRPQMQDLHFIVDHHSLIQKDLARQIFYENLTEVMMELGQHKGRLGIENLTPKSKMEDYSLMSTPQEIENFLKHSLPHTQMGLLLDLGHLYVASRIFGFDAQECASHLLMEYPHKIFELHLSDNDGSFDFHKVHGADSWQLHFVEEFAEELKTVPIVFEWSHKTNTVGEIRQGVRAMIERFPEYVPRL